MRPELALKVIELDRGTQQCRPVPQKERSWRKNIKRTRPWIFMNCKRVKLLQASSVE